MESENLISKKQLEKYSKMKNYNSGQAEKDYYQEIILFILYKKYNQNLVFKGGTALTKCYGLDRFSEDLDFTADKEESFNKTIKKGLNDFYIDYLNEEKKHKNSIDLTYWIKGPLYNGQKNSMCKILLDINLVEKTIKKPEIKKIGLNIEEIPLFEVVVMNENEILTEKIRAIMTRNKARDLYDTYYLILKKATTSIKEIQEKLDRLEKKFNKKEFYDKINEKEKIWDTELKRIVKTYPKFQEVNKTITKFIKKIK
jgi:predicted nucleotidyltransferase component of viral defense system